jgi:hypothetical protein
VYKVTNPVKKVASLFLIAVYLFFACLYVVLCQRPELRVAPGIFGKTITSFLSSKSMPPGNKLAARPRIILNKRITLCSVGILLFSCVCLWFAGSRSFFNVSYISFTRQHSKKLLPLFCSWRI